VSNYIYFKKIVEKCKPKALFTMPSETSSHGGIKTSSLFVPESAVKFNIWDVVSAV